MLLGKLDSHIQKNEFDPYKKFKKNDSYLTPLIKIN